MRARLVVFPIEGRKWCFTRSFDRITADSQPSSSPPPPTLKGLWNKLTYEGRSMQGNAELAVDFISDKMNLGWINLEKAPAGTFKNKIHGLGVKLLSRVKPSEIFLKSVSKDIMKVDIIYPASLNPRLVRRRLRHIAMRGCINHKRYFYGSVTLLPFTMAFTVLPLPNVPFFWILFRAYSHWRALKTALKHGILLLRVRTRVRLLMMILVTHKTMLCSRLGFCSPLRSWRDFLLLRVQTMVLIAAEFLVSVKHTTLARRMF